MHFSDLIMDPRSNDLLTPAHAVSTKSGPRSVLAAWPGTVPDVLPVPKQDLIILARSYSTCTPHVYRTPPLFYNLIYCLDISCQQQPRPPALVHLRLILQMTTGSTKVAAIAQVRFFSGLQAAKYAQWFLMSSPLAAVCGITA
jgi:hypothetical protein